MSDSSRAFLVARNPEADSRLPYLLWLPLEDGLVLKAREPWPATARVYCHRFDEAWPENAEIVEQTPVRRCRRRGAAIDLVLERPRLARSQFVFTQVKGREAIFWQTQKTARAANPGGRIPRRRTLAGTITITVDTLSATPTASPSKQRKRSAKRSRRATTRSAPQTGACSPRSSARASTTWPPHSPTERSLSRCNDSPSSRSPPSSSRPDTRPSTSWST
jgi:hypothetical protein